MIKKQPTKKISTATVVKSPSTKTVIKPLPANPSTKTVNKSSSTKPPSIKPTPNKQAVRLVRWIGMIGGGVCLVLLGVFGVYYALTTHTVIPQVQRDDSLPKLLVLGIDAADWELVNDRLDRGKMPHLKELIGNGIRATPKTQNPTISPSIWTTVVTGKLPIKHGIQNFLSQSHTTYQEEFMRSDQRRVKALWNILSDNHVKTGVFGYWATWPPETIDGYVVTDLAVLDPEKGIVPESLKEGILLHTVKTLGIDAFAKGLSLVFPDPKSPIDPDFFAAAESQITTVDKVFRANSLYAFDKEKPEVLFQINGAVDAAQHLFLKFRWPEEYPGENDPELIAKYHDYIDSLYEKQDELIGEYMKRAGENTHIIVMSDHGVFLDPATGYRFKGFHQILEKLGFLKFLPDGSIDFSQTKAFECNNNTFDWQRRLCINLKGKYAEGIVEPGAYSALQSQIISALKTIRTESGKPLFLSVEKGMRSDGDVLYDIRRDANEENLVIGKEYIPTKVFLGLSVESGNHYANPEGPDGILVWKGPNMKKGLIVNGLRYEDLAPNILHALGYPVARDMDGVYRPEWFEIPTEPTYIDSYETKPQPLLPGFSEGLESGDHVSLEQSVAVLTSTVAVKDAFDRLCLLEEDLDRELVVDRFEGEGGAQTTQVVPLETLPRESGTLIPFDQLRFSQRDSGKYQFVRPVDLFESSFLGLWQSMSFSFDVVSKGWLRLRMASTDVSHGAASVRVTQAGVSQTIALTNTAIDTFDVPLSSNSPVTVSFLNDGQGKGWDRNVKIESMRLFAEKPVMLDEGQWFLSGKNVCIEQRTPGKVMYRVTAREPNDREENESTEAQDTALDLLQHSGEIEDDTP